MKPVYVLSIDNKPLMPCMPVKARHLLKENKAKVVKIHPFTIQLLFKCENQVQEVLLGIDAGSRFVGVSATTEKKVLFEAEVELKTDTMENISTKKEFRRARRNRKTRYRQARFNNRVSTKKKGWLAPSIRGKVDIHVQVIEKIQKILPVSKLMVEVASFDIQKIKNPDISGKGYQEGDMLGYYNVREYVLERDGHKCQICHGKSKEKKLHVHHIKSRKVAGDSPENLVTLCKVCHRDYHLGKVDLPKNYKAKRRNYAFMTEMHFIRKQAVQRIKERFPDIPVFITYGYFTKYMRNKHNLEKSHAIDARCISGNPKAEPMKCVYLFKKVRRHNRQLFKAKILKGGKLKKNQCPYTMFGFHRFDSVKFDGKLCYVNSLRTSGCFQLKNLDETKFEKNITYKKVIRLFARTGYVCGERKCVIF